MRLAIKFAYDGTKFSGSQRQPNVKTVEGEIIDCLLKHNVMTDVKASKFQMASRTDAGVSALGNVFAFNTELSEKNILNILNSKINDCWFYGTSVVDADFNPRYAKTRWYRYHLYNGTLSTGQPNITIEDGAKEESIPKLDIDLLKSTAKLFQGTHDFKNFSKPNLENTKRTIDSISISGNDEWVLIDFKAQSFLWHQVRRLVNSWVVVARGEKSSKELEDALNNPTHDYDFGLATAEPLFLVDIEYDYQFLVDREILKRMRSKLMLKWQETHLRQRLLANLSQRI